MQPMFSARVSPGFSVYEGRDCGRGGSGGKQGAGPHRRCELTRSLGLALGYERFRLRELGV